jgi:hypothetical protein
MEFNPFLYTPSAINVLTIVNNHVEGVLSNPFVDGPPEAGEDIAH